jgi:hypothetical protein
VLLCQGVVYHIVQINVSFSNQIIVEVIQKFCYCRIILVVVHWTKVIYLSESTDSVEKCYSIKYFSNIFCQHYTYICKLNDEMLIIDLSPFNTKWPSRSFP